MRRSRKHLRPRSTRARERVLVGRHSPSELRRQPIVVTRGLEVAVTVSVGVGGWSGEGALDEVIAVEAVDAALYRAKAEGRNRVVPI